MPEGDKPDHSGSDLLQSRTRPWVHTNMQSISTGIEAKRDGFEGVVQIWESGENSLMGKKKKKKAMNSQKCQFCPEAGKMKDRMSGFNT